MSEWREPKDAPKDGSLIIVVLKNESEITFEKYFLLKWVEGKGWYDASRLIWWDNPSYFLGWMPLPEPPKKKHQCGEEIECYRDVNGDMFLQIYNQHGRMSILGVNFCPYCGEKA